MARVTSVSSRLLVLVGSAGATSFYDMHPPTIDGCFFQEHKYIGDDLGTPTLEENYTMCQLRCQDHEDCQYFTHFQSKHCWLNGKNAVYDDKWAAGAITGPKYCPILPSGCTELPGAGFPGNTPDESEQAWPSHRIPEKLECWPRNKTRGWYDSCPTITVLEDTKHGWPGKCKGLYQVPVTSGETCDSLCRKKVTCSVYQVLDDDTNSCWHGEGVDCFHGGDLTPQYGARVMHGEVRVLADLKGIQIMGLQPAFDAYYFQNQSHDAVDACRNHCYSNAECEYWQYSSSNGCWAENPDLTQWTGMVEYPITTRSWQRGTEFAASVLEGEYIQHVCKGAADVPEKFSASYVPSDLPMGPGSHAQAPVESNRFGDVEPAPAIMSLTGGAGAIVGQAHDVEPVTGGAHYEGAPFLAESSVPEQEVAQHEETFLAKHGSSLLLMAIVVGILLTTVGLIWFLQPQVRLCDERRTKSSKRHVELDSSLEPLASTSDEQSWRPEWLESQASQDTQSEQSSIGQQSSAALPFPEAGLPPRHGLPFPEVGLRPGAYDHLV